MRCSILRIARLRSRRLLLQPVRRRLFAACVSVRVFLGILRFLFSSRRLREEEIAVGLEIANVDLVAALDVLREIIDAELDLGLLDLVLAALLGAFAQLPAQDAERGSSISSASADHRGALLDQSAPLLRRPRRAARGRPRFPPGCASVSSSRFSILAW